MTTKILVGKALIDDPSAMQTLLAQVPEGDQLGNMFVAGQSGKAQRYFRELRTAIFAVSDGRIVLCFTVTEVTADQAVAIAAQCERIKNWSTTEFERAVERALDGKAIRPN